MNRDELRRLRLRKFDNINNNNEDNSSNNNNDNNNIDTTNNNQLVYNNDNNDNNQLVNNNDNVMLSNFYEKSSSSSSRQYNNIIDISKDDDENIENNKNIVDSKETYSSSKVVQFEPINLIENEYDLSQIYQTKIGDYKMEIHDFFTESSSSSSSSSNNNNNNDNYFTDPDFQPNADSIDGRKVITNNINNNNSNNYVRLCKCKEPVKLLQVHKGNQNKGRYFQVCNKKKCNFFSWADNAQHDENVSNQIIWKRFTSEQGWKIINSNKEFKPEHIQQGN